MVLIKSSAFVYQNNDWVSQIDSTINSCNIGAIKWLGDGANDNDSTNIDADVDALDVGSG